MPRFEPMSPRRRLQVLGALAAVVALLLAVIWFLGRPIESRGDLAWNDVDFASLPEVDLLRRYIQVDTSQGSGSELAGAEFLAAELAALGLEPQIERLGEKRANLWAILEGETRDALVLHSHIDVSPPGDLEQWSFPPFAADIDLFWLYGRGAFDMKSVTAAQLLALADLARAPERPRRSIIFLATGSEEIGSQLGTRWVLDQHPDLVERAWAVLSEGGVLEPKNLEEIKYWGIEFAQKRYLTGYLCGDSEAQLEELATHVIVASRQRYEPRITPEVETFIDAYAGTRENAAYSRILTERWRALADPIQFKALPGYLQALFREEIYFFPAEQDSGGGWRTRFFIHLLPGADAEEAKARLLPAWATHGATVTFHPRPLGADGGSPLDHEAFRDLVAAVREKHPEAPVGPFFLSQSATDSRFFRQLGIPSYGFSPFVIFNTDTFRKDKPNERIGLPGYVMGVDLYRDAVARLAGSSAPGS